MSKLETNQVDPSTGTTLTLGTSGDTIAIPSGVTIANSGTATGFGGANTPAFYSYKNANQTITSGTITKITFETEQFDVGSGYDSNKFQPQTAGKYYIETGLTMQAGTSEMIESRIYIYKNGSNYSYAYGAHQNNYSNYEARTWSSIIEMNGSSDYVEIYCRCTDNSGNPSVAEHSPRGSWFQGFKLIT